MAYTVDKEISSNGYASVSLAAGEEGGRRVNAAVKHIRVPSKERYDEVLKQYEFDKDQTESYFIGFAEDLSGAVNAMATLSKKDSRRILKVYEHSGNKQDNPLTFQITLVTEYLPSLDEVMSRDGLTLGQAVRVGMDICDALALCHENDVIHGGLKEKNIFVSEGTPKEPGGYKLGDIGLSRILWDPTKAAQAESSAYLAPEIFKGEYAEEAADIYSMGIILFKMFNDGRMPFSPIVPPHTSGTGVDSGEERRRSGEIPPAPRKAGERLGSIIRKACGPKDRRQKNAKALKDELAKYYETLTDAERNSVILHPPGATVPGRRAMGQQRATAAQFDDEEDVIWPSERVERGTRGTEAPAERRAERGRGRYAEAGSRETGVEQPDAAMEADSADVDEFLGRNDFDRREERVSDRDIGRAAARALDGEASRRQRGSERGTSEGRASRSRGRGTRPSVPEGRSKAEKDSEKKKRKKEYEKAAETVRMPRAAVVVVLLVLLAGLGVGGYFVYNIFFNDPIDVFARHVAEGEFTVAADIYNERIAYNEALSVEARQILANTLEATVQDFADGLTTNADAHSLWAQIHEINILDEDVMMYFNDEIVSIFASQRAFTQGMDSFRDNEFQSAIVHLGLVGERFYRFQEAQRVLEDASREFRNNIIANLNLDAENIETYENAIVVLNNALHILPNDPGLLSQLTFVQEHLYALAAEYIPDEPDPPERTPGTELVENVNMTLTFGSHVGTYTGEVAGSPPQPHGFGTFTWRPTDNRVVYTGQWQNGRRHGQGRQEFRDGGVYYGNWDGGWFSGLGTFTYPDGRSVTSSAWSRSAISNGQGTVHGADGEIIFEGTLSADQNRLTIPGQ